ncbi:MAG: elongation factor G [Bacteroidetes bacterium]|nr:elongation factor G [Bacteroidota bacterium]
MNPNDPKLIKNVALFGHQGSGKTTLAETMLFEAGAISRRGSVEDRNTVSDYNAIEQDRGNSLFSTLMHLNWRDHKINLIDTPGFDDFVGEIHTALKVVDTVVMVLNAQYGVEVGTELIWENTQDAHKPTLFAINQLDTDKSDFDRTLEQLTERFGKQVITIQYPINEGAGFNKIVDVLRMTMYEFGPDGGKPEKKPIPSSETARAAALHNALVEAAAEHDEGLMERYFDKGTLDEEELQKGLRLAVRNADFFPVFCVSARHNMGSGRLMGFIHDICPSSADMDPARLLGGSSVKPDPKGEPLAFVFKTVNEAHLGEMSFFKVYSGTLKPGMDLQNVRKGHSERFNQLFVINGKQREAVDHLVAGDLGATVKLKDTHTNDSLSPKGKELAIQPIVFPEPRIRIALETINKGDEDKLANGLHQLTEEDPTYRVEHSAELRQTIVHGQGELHLNILRQRLEDRFKVAVQFTTPRIPYRETITRSSKADYRHKKQTGGAGQFAEVHMLVEPYEEGMPAPAGMSVRDVHEINLDWGGKLVFNWCIVGGAIDAKFSTAIMKGIMSKLEDGPLTGSYVRDVRVSVFDGKMHPVDSNDMAFKTASAMAFREAFRNAAPRLLEPIFQLTVKTPVEMSGDVMSDLQTRRAQIFGMDNDGHYQIIEARIPLAELHKYSSTLRSLTQGRAKDSIAFLEYAPVPQEIQAQIASSHKEVLEEV